MTAWITEGEVLGIVWFMAGALTAVTTIGTFVELRNLTVVGYKWNIAMLCSYFIRTSLGVQPTWWESGTILRFDLSTVPITVTVGMLVWLLANLIYFKKRRHLFCAYTEAEVAAAIQGEPAPALPARREETEVMTNAGIKAPLKSSKTSTKWLLFYLNGYLTFMLAYAVYSIPKTLTSLPVIVEWIKDGNYLPLIGFPAEILAGVSAIIAFIKTRNLKASGYKWNIVMICSYYIAFVVGAFLLETVDQTKPAILNRVMFAAIMLYLFAWVVPNLIYFKKRRHLFHLDTTAEVAAAIKGEPTVPALPIRKPCHYKPSKAKVDTQRLFRLQADGKAARFMRIMLKHRRK